MITQCLEPGPTGTGLSPFFNKIIFATLLSLTNGTASFIARIAYEILIEAVNKANKQFIYLGPGGNPIQLLFFVGPGT